MSAGVAGSAGWGLYDASEPSERRDAGLWADRTLEDGG